MLDRLADGIALRRGGGLLRARTGEAGRSGEAVRRLWGMAFDTLAGDCDEGFENSRDALPCPAERCCGMP